MALTPYMAPAGGQKAATFFSKPLDAVRRNPERLHQALAGWRRLDGFTGENLDHRVIHIAADTPTGESTPAGVPGATWLAVQALPLLRLTGDGNRPQATLWHRHRKSRIMVWPVWKPDLDLDAVQALIEHRALSPRPRTDDDQVPPVLSRRRLAPLGVITAAAAQRRLVPGGKSAGVLVPTPVHLE
ncbi:hypothetical protein ABH917_000864 [Thermobifida halotolerans]